MPRSLLPLLVVLLPLAVAAEAPRSIAEWQGRQVEASLPAFVSWSPSAGQKVPVADPFQIPRSRMSCADTTLVPLSPYQDTKNYEASFFARFDHGKLPARSPLCRTRDFSASRCLAPDSVSLILISDFYGDRCGGVHKGYWTISFQRSHESMGTLLSKGRTVYPKPGSPEGFLDVEEGDTYPVSVADFEFLTEPTAAERERVEHGREHALRFGFRQDDRGLFRRVK